MTDKKTHTVPTTMTEANYQRYKALLAHYYGTTPGSRLGTLAVRDMLELMKRNHEDKEAGFLIDY